MQDNHYRKLSEVLSTRNSISQSIQNTNYEDFISGARHTLANQQNSNVIVGSHIQWFLFGFLIALIGDGVSHKFLDFCMWLIN